MTKWHPEGLVWEVLGSLWVIVREALAKESEVEGQGRVNLPRPPPQVQRERADAGCVMIALCYLFRLGRCGGSE